MEQRGLIRGYLITGDGGARTVDWTAVGDWRADEGLLWIHLDRNEAETSRWVRHESGLDRITADALLAEETRPRIFASGAGLLVILRGVNLNPGADPADMVSLRLYLDAEHIISIRYRRVMAVADLAEQLDKGEGPRSTGEFLARIAERLVARMDPVLTALEEEADDLEKDMEEAEASSIRLRLRELRQTAIVLKRYLSPQREMMLALQREPRDWLSDDDRLQFREVGDRLTRYVEQLEALRERIALLQDELVSRISERTNHTVYILTVVAAIMLPLSVITGLLGINVGGVPGTDTPLAFWVVCLFLVGIAFGVLWLFRRLKWI